MKIEKGLISVIMSNYNTPETFLRESIQSILNQTYTNFEFIIVDDASTDDSLAIIESYSDQRIKIIKNTENLGLTRSLNKALDECNGEYVARMDSDDVSLPERFRKQVDFLRNNDATVCGTWVEFFGISDVLNSEKTLCKILPEKNIFRIYQLFGNSPNIVHPSAMFNRTKLIEKGIRYDEKFRYSQDYKMWVSCANSGTCAIVPEILLKYRVSTSNISFLKKDQQLECVYGIIQEQLDLLHLKLTDEIKPLHLLLLTTRKQYDPKIREWIKSLIAANKKHRVYDQKSFSNLLWKKWAETTYFALRKSKSIKRIKLLMMLPIRYWNELLVIRKSRRYN